MNTKIKLRKKIILKAEKLSNKNLTKRTILTLIGDNKKYINEKLDNKNVQIYTNKMDKIENENVNEKDNADENINLNINVNTNNDFKDYEKNLSVNLHKNNERRC